jgi:hypothetical protein
MSRTILLLPLYSWMPGTLLCVNWWLHFCLSNFIRLVSVTYESPFIIRCFKMSFTFIFVCLETTWILFFQATGISCTSDVHKLRVDHGPHCGNPCHKIYQRLEQVLDMIFKSQKCLMPGEQIWYSCLEIVNTAHPMIPLSFSLVHGVVSYVLCFRLPHRK